MIRDNSSQVINLMRPFLLLLVIFNHCTGNVMGGGNTLIFSLLQTTMGSTLTRSAVNSFFLISGFLFFYHVKVVNKDMFVRKLNKRSTSLVLPYLIWNGIGICLMVGFNYLKKQQDIDSLSLTNLISGFWCCNEWASNRTNILGWSTPMYGPADLPLWYLRDLIVVTFLSPLVYIGVKYAGKWLIVLLSLLYVFNMWIQIPGFSICALFFWSFGAWLACNERGIVPIFSSVEKSIIIVIVIILLPIVTWMKHIDGTWFLTDILHNILTIGLIMFYLMITDKIVKNKKGFERWPLLISSSFFVYAAHDLPQINPIVIMRTIIGVLPDVEILNGVYYMIAPFVVYAISLLVFATMNRITPKMVRILSGGRS